MDRQRALRTVSWAMAAAFAFFGAMKFLGGEMVQDQFEGWDYPGWLAYATGILELAAAGLLAFRATRLPGAMLGAAVMVGAAITHLKEPEVGLLPVAIPLLAGCLWVGWSLRPASLRRPASPRPA